MNARNHLSKIGPPTFSALPPEPPSEPTPEPVPLAVAEARAVAIQQRFRLREERLAYLKQVGISLGFILESIKAALRVSEQLEAATAVIGDGDLEQANAIRLGLQRAIYPRLVNVLTPALPAPAATPETEVLSNG
jgi:hypothetical protein